jgi:hypothetical protein
VDVQTVSVVTAVISAAVAALGLLLNWYRREENEKKDKSRWVFVVTCVGIVVLTVVGVATTFVLGVGTKASVDIEHPGASMPLTEVQYKGQVGIICSDAKEKARRIQELQARETVLGAAIQIEQDEEVQVAKLRPPDKLKNAHEDMVSVWQRRIGLLESVYHRLPQLSDSELAVELAAADRLAVQLAESFQSLGVPECIM